MKNLLTRRTIRQYSDKPVDDGLLNGLMEAASRTQTMGNLQLYSVVVTRSQELKQQLAPAHFNQPMVTQAPVVLTICADFRRTSQWARCRQAEPGYDNFLSFINAATDALLFTQTLCASWTRRDWATAIWALPSISPSASLKCCSCHDWSCLSQR